MLRVLVLHNRYRFAGGEDVVVQQETAMLREFGAKVRLFEVNNNSIVSPRQQIRAATGTFYSRQMRSEVSEVIRQFRPTVMHVHNFMPRLSPSVYDAAQEHGCPVVQTLHNYRLLCANAQLFRDNQPCHDCVGRAYGWPGVLHRCYRGSALGSGVVAGMTAWHRARGTWKTRVDRYIVLTRFARDLFAQSGVIPIDRMCVKPNAVVDSGVGIGGGNYLLYVGRLSPEKGIRVLLQAAREGDGFSIPLKIAGAGPLEGEVRAAECAGRVEYLGSQPRAEIALLMQQATALLFPSLWYEGLPVVIIEAFATGLPVVASRLGAIAELVAPEKNGLLAEPGSVEEFQIAVKRLTSSRESRTELGRNARVTYETNYTPQANLQMLLKVYEEACSSSTNSLRRQVAPRERRH
jgi:glycosyltransferase involved in cell wall biosynthesis